MSKVYKSDRLSFTQLLLALVALCMSSMIAAVIVASLLVDPMRHFMRWVTAFLLIAASIFGASFAALCVWLMVRVVNRPRKPGFALCTLVAVMVTPLAYVGAAKSRNSFRSDLSMTLNGLD